MASPSGKLSLKLLVDKKSNKVLFAEAGKDFIDFLFSLLALPIGTVIRLLTKGGMVGSLGNLYDSVENLNDTYVQSAPNKELLLKPVTPVCVTQLPLLLLADGGPSSIRPPAKTIYTCSSQYYNHNHYVSDSSRAVCPSCLSSMSKALNYVAPPAATATSGPEGGYVKGVLTYMVMDDLAVKPMSTISCIALLNQFNVKDLGSLQERIVEMGTPEGLKLLKASMQTKMVLTSVFVGGNK